MGGCCSSASTVPQEAPTDAPARGRSASVRAAATAKKKESSKSKKKSARGDDFTSLDHVDSRGKRIGNLVSQHSSETHSATQGCTATGTTHGPTSYPSHTPITSGMMDALMRTPETGSTGGATGSRGPAMPMQTLGGPAPSVALGADERRAYALLSGTARREGLLSDIFLISASSSTSSEIVEHDALSWSQVEVSQPTQSFRASPGGNLSAHHHDRTFSEFDMTSEREVTADRTLRRRPASGASKTADRARLQHLIAVEAEARASLAQMYAQQHRRGLMRFLKEQYIDQRVMMLQAHQAERTAYCARWLLACERAEREAVAREWWTERDSMARRVNASSSGDAAAAARASATTTVTNTACHVELSDGGRREGSFLPANSSTQAEEWTASEVTGEESVERCHSLSIRFAAQESVGGVAADGSHSLPASQPLGATQLDSEATPSVQSAAVGAARRVSTAQQALRDRMTRNSKTSLQTSEVF